MRSLEWGKFSAQHADFVYRQIVGSSIIVDGYGSNGSEVPGPGDQPIFIGRGTEMSRACEKGLLKVALGNIRAQIGYTPIVLYAALHVWQREQGSQTPSGGETYSLYRLVAPGIDYTDATYRYKDASALATWTNDAYGVLHGADALANPIVKLLVPKRASGAMPTYSDTFVITGELQSRLRNGQDLEMLVRWEPLGGILDGNVNMQWYFSTAGKYPYLEVLYLLPLEFFASKAASPFAIDLARPLDNTVDVTLDLGAYERGETGAAVKCFLRNFTGRMLPHVEVLDDHPEWTLPVQTVGTTGVLTHVQLDEGAVSQAYEIEFTSATAYQIKATAYRDNPVNLNPVAGGAGWTGAVTGDWDAPAGGCHIPAAAWDGSHSSGDTWVFNVIGNTTDLAWPADSNEQVQMAADDGTGLAPAAATWRPIKARRILSAAAVTIDATTKKIPTRAINPSQWGIGDPAFIADADHIHEGVVDSVDTEEVAAAVFTGSGLDDCTSSGHYRGTTDEDYEVEIDGTGTPDTFRWRKGAGAWTSGVDITGSAQAIGTEGVYVTFGATTGHTASDTWTIAVTAWGVTLSGLTDDSTVYGAGAKVATSLPIRSLESGTFALSTGVAGAGELAEDFIPLTGAAGMGFAAAELIYIQDIGDPTKYEEAIIDSVDGNGITLTTKLAKHYVAGSPVMEIGSGEAAIWLRAKVSPTTVQEYKRVRLNVRV